MASLLVLPLASASPVAAQPAEQKPAPKTPALETPAPNRTVVVLGHIRMPGSYPFMAGENVMALLKRAGGAIPSAAPQAAHLLRDGVAIPLDFSRPEAELAKLTLREGDALIMPQAKRRIWVMGDVKRPGYFPLQKDEITVLDALNMAGGPLSNSGKTKITIVRGKSDLPMAERHDWSGKADDSVLRIRLQDGDGLYVQRVRSRAPLGGFGPIWPLLPRRSAPMKLLSY